MVIYIFLGQSDMMITVIVDVNYLFFHELLPNKLNTIVRQNLWIETFI